MAQLERETRACASSEPVKASRGTTRFRLIQTRACP